MTRLLQVAWESVREGNQVVARGRPRRVVVARHTAERVVDVLLEDGSRERHDAKDRVHVVLLGDPGERAPDDARADPGTCRSHDAGV